VENGKPLRSDDKKSGFTSSESYGRCVRPQRPRLRLEAKVVIGFVCSNPEPIALAVPLACDRAITSANLYGVDAALLLKS